MSTNIIKSNTSKLLRKVEKMINFNFPEKNKKRFIYFSPNGSLTDKTIDDSIKSFFIKTKNIHNKDLAFGYNLIFKSGSMKDLHNFISDNDLRRKHNLRSNILKKSPSFNLKKNNHFLSNMKNSSQNLINNNNFGISKININKPIYNNAFDINKELDSFISLSPTKRIKISSNENGDFNFNTSRSVKNKINLNNNKNNNLEVKKYFTKINWSNLRNDIKIKDKIN